MLTWWTTKPGGAKTVTYIILLVSLISHPFFQEAVSMMRNYVTIPQRRLQHLARQYISHARMQIMEGKCSFIKHIIEYLSDCVLLHKGSWNWDKNCTYRGFGGSTFFILNLQPDLFFREHSPESAGGRWHWWRAEPTRWAVPVTKSKVWKPSNSLSGMNSAPLSSQRGASAS